MMASPHHEENPIYQNVDTEMDSRITVKRNISYNNVVLSDESSNKLCSKDVNSDGSNNSKDIGTAGKPSTGKKTAIVIVIVSVFAVFVLLVGSAVAASVLSEISKLKSSTNGAVLQQGIAFSSMLEHAQMNVSLEVMMYQQLVRDLEVRIQQLQDSTLQMVTALDARITQVQTFSSQQYSTVQDFSNATAAVVARMIQEAEQMSSAISTLQQRSAHNDSTLDTRLTAVVNSSRTAHQLLNRSIFVLNSILGKYSTYPAPTCDTLPSSFPAGNYYILSSTGSAVRQYCPSISTLPCGQTGRWRSVANLDMTNSTNQCLSGLRQHTYSNKRLCVRSSDRSGCSSVQLPTTTAYRSVCGLVRAYQFGYPEAFVSSSSIDLLYVDGVSITHGNPRQHIWTFAAAGNEERPHHNSDGCPCMGGSNERPVVVGNDYFCDTAVTSDIRSVFYGDDPLWDGTGCGPNNTCCSFNTPPWFYKELPQYTTDSIELRLCCNYLQEEEDIAVESIQIYVK